LIRVKGNPEMKRYTFPLLFSVVLSLTLTVAAFAQGSTFTDKNVEYTFDLPEAAWKMTVKPSTATPAVEYVYGDRLDGHLEIRKLSVKADEILSDIILREQEQKLQFKPGFVAGKEESFAGAYRGRVFNYEFVQSGKNMSGRFYYLKADDTTVYVLRFTGLRDELRTIRNQVDSIARTFKVKTSA
jgi:hypothetical protein